MINNFASIYVIHKLYKFYIENFFKATFSPLISEIIEMFIYMKQQVIMLVRRKL